MKQEKTIEADQITPQDLEHEKEIKELLTFGFDVQDGMNRSLADDGKLTGSDLPNLWPLFRSAGPAFDNLGNPLNRWKQLSAEGKARIKAWAKERFDLIDDLLELLIEDTLVFVGQTVENALRLTGRWTRYLNAA